MSDSKEKTGKPAWVLTFYSYKGGVGRTLALSNIARYLSEELGYRVGLIDLDTESPGLANEPLCRALDRDTEDPGRKRETEQTSSEYTTKGEEIRRTINLSRGFIEFFTEIYKQAKSSPWFDQLRNDLPSTKAIAQFKDLSSFCSNVKLFDYVVPLPVEGNGGVFLMPAGRRVGRQSVELRQFRKFNNIISDRKNDNLSSVLTSALLREFIDTLHLDFVLIDGRTGLTPFFQVYVYTIPHALVLFMGLNEQNVSGSLSILRNASSPTPVYPAPVFLVASPVPTVNPEQLELRLTSIQKELEEIELPDGRYSFYSLPRKIEYFLPYVDLASYQETYFIKKYPHSALSREYVRLAHSIEGLVASAGPGERPARPRTSDESKAMFAEIVKETHGQSESPQFNIAAEDIIQNKLSDFIIERLGLKPNNWIPNGADQRFAIREFVPKDGESQKPFTLRLRLWSATEPEAPWARLVDSKDATAFANSANNQFDVIVLPQSFVGSLGEGQIWRFDEIRRGFSDLSSKFSVLSYDFLDRTYPGWRRLCSNRHGIAGLPFSANTTLLCANSQLLSELCNKFWERKKFPEAKDTGRSLFFPSSWNLIRELLETVTIDRNVGWYAFALAEHARALYYEWMNVVLARGGGDLEVVEGDVVTDILLKDNSATEEGTQLFLDLASMAEPKPDRDMVEVQDLYRKEKLALYVAWSDSFRFEPSSDPKVEGRLSAESPLPEVDPNSSLASDFMQLGMLPRDMRYSRRPLVAGWLMVFPRHDRSISEEKTRLKLVLTFAELFLDASAQEGLLRRGFPSACLPIIENEIRLTSEHGGRSRTQRSSKFLQNYLVFLKSQRAAMTNGHWVPAVSNSSEVINLIAESLARAVENKRQNQATDSSLEEVFREDLIKEIEGLIRDPRTNGSGAH